MYVSLTSVVLVDLLGIERLTNSFGLLLLFQGVATIVGPPVAGMYTRWHCGAELSVMYIFGLFCNCKLSTYLHKVLFAISNRDASLD